MGLAGLFYMVCFSIAGFNTIVEEKVRQREADIVISYPKEGYGAPDAIHGDFSGLPYRPDVLSR